MIDLANKRLGNYASTSMCGRKDYFVDDAAKICVDDKLEIETISISESDRCEARFVAKWGKK